MDYSNLQTTSAPPEASSMIETFRAIGYGIETALADIVDNSVSAGAANVWINFEWLGEKTWLSIADDGVGMNNDELIQALRPGSKNPLTERDTKDLGRFGLGLKTASFSQCRRVTALSKKKNYNSCYWTWDLDYVNQTKEWNLIKYLPEGDFEKRLGKQESGTIVIWSEMDRLVKGLNQEDNKSLSKFMEIMERCKRHLAMVFHRFIEAGRIKLHFQERRISAWNPFMTDEPATQGLPEEPLLNGKAHVKGYVLPHKSKITDEKFKEAEGPKGWNEQQGFYVYRNDRLLLSGDWLGMFRKEEHYKLARIEISLPNSMDSQWQIDIKKSIARPPILVYDQLRSYAMTVRAQAVEVYRHRGKNVKPQPGLKFVSFWVDHKRGDKWFYKINRDHPLVVHTKELIDGKSGQVLEGLLKYIEETIPIKSIYIRESENLEDMGKPFEGLDQEPIRKAMSAMYRNLIAAGKSDEVAKSIIINNEPFNHFSHLLEFINAKTKEE